MEEKSNVTLKKIQEAAMAEFLDKGFQGASLRQIVKNAGVTTGAFYTRIKELIWTMVARIFINIIMLDGWGLWGIKVHLFLRI